MIKKVFIGLGSNIGDKKEVLQQAVDNIAELEGISLSKLSSFYQTSPWGKTDQEDFINQVLEIETSLSALDLLRNLQEIEIKLGRQRKEKWGPRTIDLDILLYGEEIIELEELKVPHPYIQQRLFVLVPMQEINPELVFPDGTRIEEVLDRVIAQEGGQGIRKLS